MTRVVSEHQHRLALRPCELFRISDQSTNGSAEVIEIHRRGPHTRMLRSFVRSPAALLGLRHDAADRSPAQSAGAECESFKKPIVEFLPCPSVDQLLNREGRDGARRAGKQ